MNSDMETCKVKLTEAVKQSQVALATACNAIEALASVAKNRSDCGAVAIMGELVYRQLKKKTAELNAKLEQELRIKTK